jgi:L-lysine 6-transaminase
MQNEECRIAFQSKIQVLKSKILQGIKMAKIAPKDVIPTIRQHLIGDGFEFVVDMKKSQGSVIVDAITGRELLDFYSCFASNPIGFNHPKMKDKVFIEKIQWCAVHNITNSDLFTEYKAEFVDYFWKTTAPKHMKYMFMIAGGALGIENALKAAFDWKVQLNRKRGDTRGTGTKVMHLSGAFHGRTGYTMSLTNTDPLKTDNFPKFIWPRIDAPSISFPDKGKAHDDLLKREARALEQAKAHIYADSHDIAAFIMEPIQGEGGDNHFRGEFMRAMQDLCRENHIMFIVDEVQTGVGLSGKMWAFEHYGIEPDMLVFGKKMQVCGFLSSDRIDSIESNVFHASGRINSTWGGTLIDMVRAQRYLEIIHEDKLVENAEKTGGVLLKEIEGLVKAHKDLLSNPRGKGLMCAFDVRTQTERNKLRGLCYDEGVLVLNSGEKSIRFRPGLNLTPEEAKRGVGIIDKAIIKL